MLNRRSFIAALVAAAVARTSLAAEMPEVSVYLNPN